MYFDEEFLKSLPDDWPHAVEKIAQRFHSFMEIYNFDSVKYYSIVQEVQLLLQVFCRKHQLSQRRLPNLTGTRKANIDNINKFIGYLLNDSKKYIQQQTDAKRLKHYKNVFEIAIEDAFHYEFSEGDLDIIQNLINELRKLISTTKELKEEHKRRLLSKLEKVQTELHKRVSDLDRFWGFCIDASIVAGLMGENAKPMFDLIKKIVDIVWPAQTRAYELPSSLPFKLLGQAEDNKSKNNKS